MSKRPAESMSNEEYFKNFLGGGQCEYNNDLKWASEMGIKYLQKIAPRYKASGRIGLVVLDLDGTLFFDDPCSILGMHELDMGIHMGQEVFCLPPNPSIVNMAKIAKQLGFKVICLTARPKESTLASKYNLFMLQIPHDQLITNDVEEKRKDYAFKIKVRKDLASKPNTDIVLTCGDNPMDVYMPGGSTCAIKLPHFDLDENGQGSQSKCSYVYIPDEVKK